MKITNVEAIPCRGSWMNWTFVKVSTDEGITGWGDATEWVRVKGHMAAIQDLSALVIGENPFNIEKLWQKMWVASYAGGKADPFDEKIARLSEKLDDTRLYYGSAEDRETRWSV